MVTAGSAPVVQRHIELICPHRAVFRATQETAGFGTVRIGVARSNENNKERRMNESQETPPPESFTKDELKRALKAFKKRLKLTRADDESRLGYGAMSGGGESGVMAIIPPDQHPKAVWDELVRQGRLKYAGHGLYELANS